MIDAFYLFLFAGIMFSFLGGISCLEFASNESTPLIVRQLSNAIAVAMGIVILLCVIATKFAY